MYKKVLVGGVLPIRCHAMQFLRLPIMHRQLTFSAFPRNSQHKASLCLHNTKASSVTRRTRLTSQFSFYTIQVYVRILVLNHSGIISLDWRISQVKVFSERWRDVVVCQKVLACCALVVAHEPKWASSSYLLPRKNNFKNISLSERWQRHASFICSTAIEFTSSIPSKICWWRQKRNLALSSPWRNTTSHFQGYLSWATELFLS